MNWVMRRHDCPPCSADPFAGGFMTKELSEFDVLQIRTTIDNAHRDIEERVKIAVYELTHPMNGKIALDNVAVQLVGIAVSQGIETKMKEIMKDIVE